ncbi:MAG: hypothetical protein V2I97_12740 [Desulfococcaceae bacterium]|jgi:serine/threonine protein kinase|nr:hypothetical protein [Desulfococcaceae bacterium]
MKILTDSKKRKIILEKDIAGGGEARIWTVKGQPGAVAKIYHHPDSGHEAKISAMLSAPPPQPKTHTAIAWPQEILYDGQKFAGFTMPCITDSLLIFQMYNPAQRQKLSADFNWEHLHRVAYNLAIAVHAVHSVGHVVGDVNESNILVNKDRGFVTLIDTDSFQVGDKNNGLYRCFVGKPEFTPPELQGTDFKTTDRLKEHDLFGLGVMLFYLLMEGFHPFTGVLKNTALSVGRVDLHCIRNGIFPFHKNGKVSPSPNAPSFTVLYPDIQKAFIRCFVNGYKNPARRPSAEEWIKLLELAEKKLKPCRHNPNHIFSTHVKSCPWCNTPAQVQKNTSFVMGQQKAFKNAPSPASASQKTPVVKDNLPNSFLFILQWFTACSLGWGLAGAFVLGLIENNVLSWFLFGTAGGIAQWFVINRNISFLWIFMSSVQWIIFGTAGREIDSMMLKLLPELRNITSGYHFILPVFNSPYFVKAAGHSLIAFSGGFAQWILLRKKFRKAYLWIPACIMGSMGGILVTNITLGTWQYRILSFLGAAANKNMNTGIYWAVFGGVFAIISGIVLCRMIRNPKF